MRLTVLTSILLAGAASCAEPDVLISAEPGPDVSSVPGPPGGDETPLDPTQIDRVCARGNGDPIARALCRKPALGGLTDLIAALKLDRPEERAFAATGNSTSLVARFTTPLNPRVLIFTSPSVQTIANTRAMGFVRGEQFVELAGYDEVKRDLNFYLLRFEQDCNTRDGGCTLADLVTPAVERNWRGWTIQQDVDLVNTPIDCLVCHQPKGPGTKKMFRMQELFNPWLHWFPGGRFAGPAAPSGGLLSESEVVLGARFREAKEGEERYAGIPIAALLSNVETEDADGAPAFDAGGIALEIFLENFSFFGEVELIDLGESGSSETFELPFDSAQVLVERDRGTRDTWLRYDQQVRRGERIPVPFYDVDTSDPARRAEATASYRGVVEGSAPREQLLDPRLIFSDEALVAMNFTPAAEQSGEEILGRFCERCHNDRLDQNVSRARFQPKKIAELSREYRSMVIDRLRADQRSPLKMPPPRFATLPDWAIDRIEEYLQVR